MTDDLEYTESSGSVWEDLGYPDAEERMAKALLSRWIDKQIQVRGLNQTQAAELLGVSQPDVSKLVRGRVSGFSLERLARMINALGHDVRISVAPQEDRERAHLLVSV
ncbi:hypothetical protein BH20GEM2_BH20GEM2_09290 [soil metagenome]